MSIFNFFIKHALCIKYFFTIVVPPPYFAGLGWIKNQDLYVVLVKELYMLQGSLIIKIFLTVFVVKFAVVIYRRNTRYHIVIFGRNKLLCILFRNQQSILVSQHISVAVAISIKWQIFCTSDVDCVAQPLYKCAVTASGIID